MNVRYPALPIDDAGLLIAYRIQSGFYLAQVPSIAQLDQDPTRPASSPRIDHLNAPHMIRHDNRHTDGRPLILGRSEGEIPMLVPSPAVEAGNGGPV